MSSSTPPLARLLIGAATLFSGCAAGVLLYVRGLDAVSALAAAVALLSAALGTTLIRIFRMRAEVAANAERFRRLEAGNFDAILLLDGQAVVDANDRFVGMFGYTQDEARGMGLEHLVAPETLGLTLDRIRSAYPRPFRIRVRHRDGTAFPAEVNARILHASDGELVVVSLRDLRGRDAAYREHDLLATAVEQAGDAIEIANADGELEYVNPAFEKITGYRFREVVGRQPSSFLRTDEQPEEPLEEAWRAVREGRTWSGKLVSRHRSGEPIHQEVSIAPVRDEHGDISHFVCVRHDISEWHRAEAKLRESEERYRELFENANDLIFVFDLDGNIISINRAAARLSGYNLEEATHMKLDRFLTTHSARRARQLVFRLLREDAPANAEFALLTKGGDTVELDVSARLVYRDGRPVAIQGIARDITERKRMEAELRTRIAFETLLTTLSTHFNDLRPDEIDMGIGDALQRIAEFTGVDRSYVCRLDPSESVAEITHEWTAAGIPARRNTLREIRLDRVPDLAVRIAAQETVLLEDLEGLVPADSELPDAAVRGIKTLLCVPMAQGGQVVGFLGFESLRRHQQWSDAMFQRLRTVGEMFVYALERRRTEEALIESRERYALAVRAANEGLWDWNLVTNEIYLSPRWKSLVGDPGDELPSTLETWFDRVHPDDRELLHAAIDAHLAGEADQLDNEHRLRVEAGDYRWMLCRGLAVRDESGQAVRMAGSIADISKRKAAERQLMHAALHDSLTGLPNRALIEDRLIQAMQRAQRNPEYLFAVLFLDLDRFKVINDSLGHDIGDRLLVEIAERLAHTVREVDTVARLGGDEFTVLVEDLLDVEEAIDVAKRIQQALRKPYYIDAHEIFTSASIGLTLSTVGYERPEDILRDADTAMYRAKSKGKARYEIFDRRMHHSAVELLRLETDLRHAVDKEQFELFFQPIVDLNEGEILGAEALIRWRHPKLGLIPPDSFIPVAEETGLIMPIGRWVMEEAGGHLARWAKRDRFEGLSLSINLSARQFDEPSLIHDLDRIVEQHGIDPRRLRLEITESMVMDHPKLAAGVLERIRNRGMLVQMDDFGTGYSSLSYLTRFPIDTLKIDRSFVSKLDTEPENLEIVVAIIALARNLGMGVIAEGVETPRQLSELRRLGCERAQGNYFAEAMPRRRFERLLAKPPGWLLEASEVG